MQSRSHHQAKAGSGGEGGARWRKSGFIISTHVDKCLHEKSISFFQCLCLTFLMTSSGFWAVSTFLSFLFCAIPWQSSWPGSCPPSAIFMASEATGVPHQWAVCEGNATEMSFFPEQFKHEPTRLVSSTICRFVSHNLWQSKGTLKCFFSSSTRELLW